MVVEVDEKKDLKESGSCGCGDSPRVEDSAANRAEVCARVAWGGDEIPLVNHATGFFFASINMQSPLPQPPPSRHFQPEKNKEQWPNLPEPVCPQSVSPKYRENGRRQSF